MTVAVSLNLSDGVVLGVDSAITLSGAIASQPNIQGIVKVYERAEKLFQLGVKPIGLATYGLGSIRNRSIGSYIREFEILDPAGAISGSLTVKEIVEEVRKFFMDIYKKTIIPDIEKETKKKWEELGDRQKPKIGIVVGGFDPNQYLSEVWRVVVPTNDTANSATLRRDKGNFGSDWFATFGPIRRYIKGYEPKLVEELANYFTQLRGSAFSNAEQDEIKKILAKYEYPIPFIAMPIEEGIAHVKFLVDLAINHHRYAVGAPIVGGQARVGLVTYKGEQFKILEGD